MKPFHFIHPRNTSQKVKKKRLLKVRKKRREGRSHIYLPLCHQQVTQNTCFCFYDQNINRAAHTKHKNSKNKKRKEKTKVTNARNNSNNNNKERRFQLVSIFSTLFYFNVIGQIVFFFPFCNCAPWFKICRLMKNVKVIYVDYKQKITHFNQIQCSYLSFIYKTLNIKCFIISIFNSIIFLEGVELARLVNIYSLYQKQSK